MNLKEQLAQAQKALDDTRSKVTEDDREEMQTRDQIQKLIDERLAEETRQRWLKVDRAIEAMRIAKGPDFPVVGVVPQGYPDFFLVTRENKAHNKYSNAVTLLARDKNPDMAAARKEFACAVVCQWNDEVRDPSDSEFTASLAKYLTANSGLCSSIIAEATELMGVLAEARKSGG